MPVNYELDPVRELIRTTCVGAVNLEEVTDHFRDLAQNPNRPDRLNVLLDLTEVTSLPAADQLREVTDTIGTLARKIRFGACAIVAGRDALFGMMRMFEIFARNYFVTTQVFRTVAEAEVWLATQRPTTRD